jgi:hypothetical protein
MKVQIGAMSVGDILDRGLKLLLARLGTFLAINLIVLSPVWIFQLFLPQMVEALTDGTPIGDMLAFVFVLFGALTLTMICRPLADAAILKVVRQEFVGQPTGVASALALAFRRFFTLFFLSLVAGLVVVLGCMTCLVPGVVFYVFFVFVGQVVVVENKGVFAALGRSQELTTGYRWRILGMLVLFVLMYGMLIAAVQTLDYFLPSAERVRTEGGMKVIFNRANYLIQMAIDVPVRTLVQTYTGVCMTLLYFDLRIRKEGYDLELAARQQALVIS